MFRHVPVLWSAYQYSTISIYCQSSCEANIRSSIFVPHFPQILCQLQMHSMEWEMGTFSLMMYSAEEMKGTFYSAGQTVGEKKIVLTLKTLG